MQEYRSREVVQAFYLPLYWGEQHWEALEAFGVLTNRQLGIAQTPDGEELSGAYFVVQTDPRLKLKFMQREDFERQYQPIQHDNLSKIEQGVFTTTAAIQELVS